MTEKLFNFLKIKKKYLKYIRSQETPGELFKNKLEQLNYFYIPISKMIYKDYKKSKNKSTRIIGLSGAQGSGKSTISKILKIILKEEYNLNTLVFSIDDFYKTSKERKKMSQKVSKLFLTRGVPGTHDSRALLSCLKNFKKEYFNKIRIPQFNKSNDDRYKKKDWIKIFKKPDIVIFEGWCVGAKPQLKNSLIKPINELERYQDKNSIWRCKVNNELKNNYKKIFKLIDFLIFLKVPSFRYVYKWRALQEKKLKKASKGKRVMSNLQIKKFIMFYERTTRQMLKTLGPLSNIVINIDTKHCLKSMKFN